jgi:Tfp pilus assembly protein FimT
MKCKGFSLIECIFAINIAAACCVFALVGVRQFIYMHNAHTTLQQLQQGICLARSIAIAQNCQVTIYPHSRSLMLEIGEQGPKKKLSLSVGAGDELSLRQSGFSNKIITVQADGMTYTNGHFNYKSRNTNALPQFNLYFNRALRTYVLVSG